MLLSEFLYTIMSGSLEPLSTVAIASGMQLYLQQGRKTKIKWHHSLTGNVLKEKGFGLDIVICGTPSLTTCIEITPPMKVNL